MRAFVSVGVVVAFIMLVGIWLSAESWAQSHGSLSGGWTLNKEASDQPPARDDRDERGARGDHGRGGFGGRGGRFGGRGGGFGGGGSGRGGGVDREEMARMRDAMRDILNAPDHLVITETDSMIVMTGPDGRTTRLAPDGQKIKDETTKIDRSTRWDGDKLVSDISGAGPGKITQTWSVDPEHRQLRVVVQVDGDRGGPPRTITHVYDSDRGQ